ncbi:MULTISPECIES: catechol 2,3-dioxygenase [Salinicoccus]|uniref:Catechol 1,2-dioxygenase n=1 Tax=Salinicoccus roseus TaxID=45670 RepID=A0A0C2HA20_9STAP|nr:MULTISPECIES: catechol 2,3-dioxygenase [Salinicoccus]KIH70650.1 catechol 1,2-dioxygenase [Salinicoccus roseus]MCC4722987.1 catechol 2,3-dioxygenase [Salinicoccus sp. RF5]MDB0580754.1 catechol 2,3-dioxygenase [Salinicoccus roseus]
MKQEPIFDVAQLAHFEIYSPKIEESVKFFTDILGMTEVAREGKSVYLRAYEDIYHNSLKITENSEAGIGHMALRARSPQALERRVKVLEEMGAGIGWVDGDVGHGPAYQFEAPDGHIMEIFWEVEYYEAPESEKTALLNRPQKRPGRGVPVRRIDHVNILASDTNKTVEFLEEALGFRVNERILADDNTDIAAWTSVSNLAHDIAIMGDMMGGKGRLHHICYWYGYAQNLSDVSDLLLDNGYEIEEGPLKHGVSQAQCMYVREPGGNRVELFGDAGYLIFDPDWKTVEWKGEDLQKAVVWHGSELQPEFMKYGTPDIPDPAEAVSEEVGAEKTNV